jgi:hypothetical protein
MLGRAPTLGCVRIGLNMIHCPMGQNKVSQYRWQKKVSAPIMILVGFDMIWTFRFDAYESRLHELSRKYLHA